MKPYNMTENKEGRGKITCVQITLLFVLFIAVSSLSLITEKRLHVLDQNYKIKKDNEHGLPLKLFTNYVSLKRIRRSLKIPNNHTRSNSAQGQLQSKASQAFLGVFKNGTVYGGFLYGDEHALLRLESYGASKIRIMAVKAKKYIAMNRRGRIYATRKKNKRNIWKEVHEKNNFSTYQSLYHFNNTDRGRFFLAIKGSGYPRNGNSSKPGMNASQFQFLKDAGRNRTK